MAKSDKNHLSAILTPQSSNPKPDECLVQITSGRGPEECARVVAKVVEVFLKEARSEGLFAEVIESTQGPLNGTLLSAVIKVKGEKLESFLSGWKGSIQWIAQSPYRKFHKRKNWFVGLEVFDVTKDFEWKEKEVVFETMRASGPGGQHVNKTESAVRAKHLPSGITVVSAERRSQLQNKNEATERLKIKVKQWQMEEASSKIKNQWDEHNSLMRGNPVKTFKERL
jgi:peptide chain release factor